MNVLYIDACPREPGVSRTLQLAERFLQVLKETQPEASVTREAVADMGLSAVDGALLKRREALIDARAWEDSMFAPARSFQAADVIITAAPYWDLMFPAMLKIYIEHVFIRELTFCYRNDEPIGLCRGTRAVFLTTSGSPIGMADFGEAYLRATFAMLGIPRLDCISAEGLDIEGADVTGLMETALRRVTALAASFG